VKTVRKVTRIDGNNALQAFKPKVRVAAYCRVSTDSDEQMASLEAQKDHYESYIKANPDWEFAGIYYDEGGVIGVHRTRKSFRFTSLFL
jgi:site-specific DNA recombinase